MFCNFLLFTYISVYLSFFSFYVIISPYTPHNSFIHLLRTPSFYYFVSPFQLSSLHYYRVENVYFLISPTLQRQFYLRMAYTIYHTHATQLLLLLPVYNGVFASKHWIKLFFVPNGLIDWYRWMFPVLVFSNPAFGTFKTSTNLFLNSSCIKILCFFTISLFSCDVSCNLFTNSLLDK